MSKRNRINDIIRTFFKSHFSKKTQQKFAWWLIHNNRQETNEEILQQLWEELQHIHTTPLQEDLLLFRQSLRKEKQRYWLQKYRTLGMVATWFVCIVITTFISFYIIKSQNQHDRVSPKLIQASTSDQSLKTVYLSDSTRVILNSESTLIYPTAFTEDTRTVFLLGEASFDVKENKEKPFIVQTHFFSVTALGTHFSVNSHNNLSYNRATLESGSIRIDFNQLKDKHTQKTFILKPNQVMEYNKLTGSIQVKNTDALLMLAWTEGKLVFDGISFADIIPQLETKYGVTIVCQNITKLKGRYFAKFDKHETLDDVLSLLSTLSYPFEYHIEGSYVQIIPPSIHNIEDTRQKNNSKNNNTHNLSQP